MHQYSSTIKAAAPEGLMILFEDDFAYATGGSRKTEFVTWTESKTPEQYLEAINIYDAGGAIKLGKSAGGSLLLPT